MHHAKWNAIEFGWKRPFSDGIGINANHSVDYIDIQVFVLIQPVRVQSVPGAGRKGL